MNKQRRSAIRVQIALLNNWATCESTDWKDLIQKAEDTVPSLEEARDDEQDYLDNMPESFQDGEKGENAQQAIDALQAGIDKLGELSDLIDPDDADMTDEDRAATVQDLINDAIEELECFE